MEQTPTEPSAKPDATIHGTMTGTALPPFTVINPDSDHAFFIICDHAGRAVPDSMNQLGLESAHFDLHVAYDIGAAALTSAMAMRMRTAAILANYSRLIVDLNRAPGDPGSIPEISDGLAIPGNQGLSEADQAKRIDDFFWPYHHAITEQLARLWRLGPAPALFSIHTFTQKPDTGDHRPWDIGVLWNRDPRIAVPLIEKLRNHPADLVVGDNEPYSGKEIAYSIDIHGGAGGLANCAVEIRQDLVQDQAGVDRWADILVPILEDILSAPNIHRVETF